ARANQKDLRVVAPFTGTVATRTAEPGEVITAGTPVITLVNLAEVYLRAFVPEGQIGRVRLSQPARVYLDSDPAKPIDAYVLRIDPQASFTPENTYFREDRVKQVISLYPDLSVAENLRYVGELRRVPVHEIERRGNRYLTMFGMERFTGRLAGRLSGGMKQKLALACALVAEPRILLLDEPTTGVDPVSRREFWDALAQLSSQGITILLATPYLDEAERCHRVALMHEGRLHQVGTPAELRQSLGLQRLEVHAADLRRAETTLAERNGIVDVQRFGDRLDVLVRDVPAGERAVREALAGAGLAVGGVRGATPTLENTFVALLRRLQGEA